MTRRELYQQFINEFPIENLKNLPIERYTNLQYNSFCYWLEFKLNGLGGIRGGSAYKFGIFKFNQKPTLNNTQYQADDEYAWLSQLGENRIEAYSKVIAQVSRIAELASRCSFDDIESENGVLYNTVKWKIAFLYSNEKLLPMYRKDMLEGLAAYSGMDNPGNASQAELNTYILSQKGDRDLYEFYDELLEILKRKSPDVEKDTNTEEAPRYWIYQLGQKSSKWERCISDGIACIGWEELGDLSSLDSVESAKTELQNTYNQKDSSFRNDALAVYEFSHKIKPGDIIFAKSGRDKLLGRGVVTSGYEFVESYEDYNNVIRVDWQKTGVWNAPCNSVVKTLTDITPYPDYVHKLDAVFADENTRNYWFLVANPNIWSLSNLETGKDTDYTLYNKNGNPRRILQNFKDARAGDLVIGYESGNIRKITSLCEISKSIEETDGKRIYFRKTHSLSVPIEYNEIQSKQELSSMEFLQNSQGSLFKLTKTEYDTLQDMILERNPVAIQTDNEKYTTADFLSEVYMNESDYDRLVALLKYKKNIILQGAPGVGKTFSAKRLAYSLMGVKDESRISFVQFHQNYSYEDFVMGYKPNVTGGFELKNGVFYNTCIQAENNPGKDYFFIIDEINRGNLSKIFGELLMLIENSYRSKEKVKLAYNGELFSVPENLYIIGMMNTADRSLAMIDYALRRRFSFFEMRPGFDTNGFKNYQNSLKNEAFNKVIEGVRTLNSVIANDNSLGDGFCIGHSYFCNNGSNDKKPVNDSENQNENWLQNVIDFDIAPMLHEYWFDDKAKADAQIKKLKDLLK